MPSLPLDLERMIFELAVFEDTDHDNRVRITLVAKRVYEWTRPILYRIAIAETTLSSPLTIRNWKNTPRTDVARFVLHLLTLISDEYLVLELLSTLPNLKNLAIWGYVSVSSEILLEINNLPLHTLSANLGRINIAEAVKNCTAFRNLTHLEILGLNGSTWNDCNALVELPKLTHLSIHHFASVKAEVGLNLLECCSSLRVLIYQAAIDDYGHLTDHDFIESNDPRYLVFLDDLPDDVREWEISANGQTGFWELADIIIEARRGKLFKDSSLFTISRTSWMDDLNDDGVRWYKEWFERAAVSDRTNGD